MMLIDVRLGLSIGQCVLFATTTTRPSQPPPHPDNDSIQSQHNQTRAQLQTSPASSSLSDVHNCVLACGCTVYLRRLVFFPHPERKNEKKKNKNKKSLSLSLV
jgi:hypothetical protein